MRFSPLIDTLGIYPFVAIDDAKRQALSDGQELIDFGIGDPHEPVEDFIRNALVSSLDGSVGYPRAVGLDVLRAAIADWCVTRFGVALDPDHEIVPTLGSKEAIFTFAHLVVDRSADKDIVLTTQPGYPVALRGARFAGGQVVELPLHESNGFLPDLDAIAAETWRRTALVWVNYPNNPTTAVAPLTWYSRLADLAERHDFILASDEAYSELYFEAPPPASALEVEDRSRFVVFNSLSKRSGMTGYRSGFIAASPPIIEAVKAFRPTTGNTPQVFVQHASVAAWRDEDHVESMRDRYRRKRDVMIPALERCGFEVVGGSTTMFLWVRTPRDEPSNQAALRLLEQGIVVTPGAALGLSGESYIRIALVPTLNDCQRAAEILTAAFDEEAA